MSTTSGNPDNLKIYIDGTTEPRSATTSKIAAAITQQGSVSAASTSHGVQGTMLPLAQTLMQNMVSNEEFVRAVRDALLDADRLDDVATIDDATVMSLLATGNYATDPVEYVMPEVAMIGLPANSGYVDDPICAANGNFVLLHVDIEFVGLSTALGLTRVYNSMDTERRGAFGAGWSSGLDVCLDIESTDEATVALADGGRVQFRRDASDNWRSHDRRRLRLARCADGWELCCEGDRFEQWRFADDGTLTGWNIDRSEVKVERAGSRIIRLVSGASDRSATFEWAADRIVGLVTDDGRSVSYDYDDEGRLLVARSAWANTDYEYTDGLMTTSTDADGVAEFVNAYEPNGRVVEQTSPFGRVTTYRYQMPGATVITDEAGVRQAMVHDKRGNLTSIIDVDGSASRYTYDALDRMTRVVDQLGNVTINEFDGPTDRISRRIDPDGHGERWSWDAQGRVIDHTWRSGAVIHYEYTGAHRTPTKITAPNGAITTAELDDHGLPIVVTDADAVVVRYAYDVDGQLVTTTDALGNTVEHTYDQAGRLVGIIDEAGVLTSMFHDEAGRLVEVALASSVVGYGYTAAGRATSGQLAGDLPWSAQYGPHGGIDWFRDGADATTAFEYDTHGHVTQVRTGTGESYRQEFDSVGRLVAVSDPSGATGRVVHDRAGRVVEVVDPVGNRTRRTVDAFGRTVEMIAADGATTGYTYHPIGEVASVTRADGRRWTFDVDELGRVIAAIDPTGARSTKTYTPAGRLLTRTTPAGRTERCGYDERGDLRTLTRTDGSVVRYDRDERGLVVAVTDGSGAVETATWDDQRRLSTVTSAGAGTTTYTRDAGGRVNAVTDATGVEQRFTYDARGLLSTAIDAAGGVTRYERDQRGRLAAQTAPGGRTTTWEFGLDGRMKGFTDPAGVVTAVDRNANGRIEGYRRGPVEWSRGFDPAGREVERTSPDGSVDRTFGYDAVGRVTMASSQSDGLGIEFLWDDHGRITGGVDGTGATTFSRDADGALTGVERARSGDIRYIRDAAGAIVGALGGTIDDIVEGNPTREYDPAGRLLAGPDGSVYRYDAAGRLIERSEPGFGVASFVYGDDGLIASENRNGMVRRFGYDAAGRVETIQVDDASTTRIEYDDAGRRVFERASDGASVHYRWSALDQLIGVDSLSADGSSTSIEIALDGLGRPGRIDGTPVGYDPITGRPAAMGETEFTRAGSLRWNSSSASWERDPARGADGIEVGPVRIIGHRTFDPATHQFLSPDPLFTVPGSAGSASAYTYAWQDPVNFVDPTGLEPISVEAYDAVIKREEQGTVGAVWEAVASDWKGTLAMVGVFAAGAALMFVPGGQAIGLGLMVGVGATVVGGLMTGEFDPRQAALNGIIGGASFGAGNLLTTGRIGATTFIAANGGIGVTQKFGEQTINGNGYDVSDIFLSGGLSMATAGIGTRVNATTYTQAALYGGGADGGAETISQLLDSDPNFSVANVVTATVSGSGGGMYDLRVSRGVSAGDGGGGTPQHVAEPDVSEVSEVSVEITPSSSSGGGQSSGTIETAPAELTVTSMNHRNVTVVGADGTRTTIDHHVTMSDGSHRYIEVRPAGTPSVEGGGLTVTENQSRVIPDIESGVAEARGAGATSVTEAAGSANAPTSVMVVADGTTIAEGAPIGGPR